MEMKNEIIWTAKPSWWVNEISKEDPDMLPDEVEQALREANKTDYDNLLRKMKRIPTPNGVLALMWSPNYPGRVVCQIKFDLAACMEKNIVDPCWFIDEDGEFRRRSEVNPEKCWKTLYREITSDVTEVSRYVEMLSGIRTIPDEVDQEITAFAVENIFENTRPLGEKLEEALEKKSVFQRLGVVV